ncbi:MAG: cellulose 1,4-beta-cellobiosidase [Ruminococcus sp.]|nr:cellulose 1,4-beta-cellobiosidase [Ruminococcus sp.]MDE7225630.1 cellulose 1,4-beta-cellobiosidase [Ruminococcus sp.]
MISKKNKALTSGILAAAMSATAIIPAFASAATEYATENGANESYAAMFESLYDDVITNGVENGYMSDKKNGDSFGIPYHSVEELCVEAPDYGHETTSEAMSYMAWITAMHDILADKGIINASSKDLEKGWRTVEAIIPGWSKNAYGSNTEYGSIWKLERLKADPAAEGDLPSDYPVPQYGGEAVNPIFNDMKSAYGSDNGYYLMHWLADVDDWYGFGGGKGQFTFINTFQRGKEESCFETVPQPCLEELKYGMTEMKDQDNGSGIKGIFNGVGQVPKQYAFTNAPDAEDRAIQAIYFANQFGLKTGELSSLAGKMGDQCRNDMFDKYYKPIGCQNTQAGSSIEGQHFLMSWYTSWGGALQASYGNYSWAWQIGCSHSHQFYQNPLAAYALAYDPAISAGMKSNNAKADYEKSLQRQIELYLWLQSADGPFAGGCTNSKNGRYEKYTDESTFYDMAYVEHPVYADPGSNHWIGNQVWSAQRLAELYYYVASNSDLITQKGDQSSQTYGGLSLEEALDSLVTRWVDWFIENTKFDYVAEDGTEMKYAIPSSLDWSGQPKTWTGTYDPNANSGLTCTITGYGQGDIGCVSSLCNTLIFYAATKGAPASAATNPNGSTLAEKALYTANKLMSLQWNNARDEIGLAYEDHNTNLKRVFEQDVYIPNGYRGTMPDGSKLEPGATFSSIREKYSTVDMYNECKAVYDATGATDDYYYTLHRFWHMGDTLMTTGTMALLYPEVKPLAEGEGDIDPPTTTEPGEEVKVTLWGDANVDGIVSVADATLILQYLGNKDKYKISEQGLANADVVDNGKGLSAVDALSIQMMDAELFDSSKWPMTSDEHNALIAK